MLSFFQRFTGSVWGRRLGIVTALATIVLSAVQPLCYGLLPASDGVMLHFYRLVALDHAVRNGDLWPRYAPGLAYGFGAPLFNYIAPLYLYPFEALHLIGFRVANAFLLGMIGYTIVAAVGAYLLGRNLGGVACGLITAAGYTYAPYLLYEWPRQGEVAAYASLAVLPWVLWAFWRLAKLGRRRDFVTAMVVYASYIPLHNPSTLIASVLFVAFCLYLWWTSPDPPRAIIRLGLAGSLAVGLMTFYWVPALFELQYSQITRSLGFLSSDFHHHFESLFEVLALPQGIDLTQMQPPIPKSLSWPQILLVLAGASVVGWEKFGWGKRETGHFWMILFGGLQALGVILAMPISTLAWEWIPLMRYIEHPSRWLGPASLFTACLAGYGVVAVARQMRREWMQAAWTGLCAAMTVMYSLPWLYGLYAPDPAARSIVDAQNYEERSGNLATGELGEYLPAWTTEMPDRSRLLGLYATDDVIARLQPNPDVTNHLMLWKTMSATLELEAQNDTTLIFDWLYFPGWWARIDGEIAAVRSNGPQGYLSIQVPQGNHTIEIGFAPTLLRLIALITSGVFALIMVLFTTLMPRSIWSRTVTEHISGLQTPWAMLGAILAAGVIVFLVKALWIDVAQTPIKRARFADGIEAGVQYPVGVTFNKEITLLGYDLLPENIVSGRTADLILYWQLTNQAIDRDYSTVIYLRDAENNTLVQIGSQYPAGLATSDWTPSLYVREALRLSIPPGTPLGVYTLYAGLYLPDSSESVTAYDAAGSPLGLLAPIGQIGVTRPTRPAQVEIPVGAKAINAAVGDELTLLWAERLPERLDVGQPYPLIWAWRAQVEPTGVYSVQIQWRQEGELAGTSPLIMPATGYATDQWQRRDVWRGVHTMTVPGRLEEGTYEVVAQVINTQNVLVGDPISLGEVRVSTPTRSFERPLLQIQADALWQSLIKLVGYDLIPARISAGDAAILTLYWQPQSDVNQNLTVLIEVLNEDGETVTRQDQIPVRGERPTTGWAPNEIVKDSYQLYIYPGAKRGSYHIQVRLYDAASGQLVVLADGTDRWIMPQRIEVR